MKKNNTKPNPRKITPKNAEKSNTPLKSTSNYANIIKYTNNTFKNFWFYISCILTIYSALNTFRAEIQIQANSYTKQDPLKSIFTITNVGYFDTNEIKMSCEIYEGNQLIFTTSNISIKENEEAPITGNPNTSSLRPTKSVTRDCGNRSNFIKLREISPNKLRIRISLEYRYFLNTIRGSSIQLFNTRKIEENEYILVPDSDQHY